MALSYRLIKFSDVIIYRKTTTGSYVRGVWTESTSITEVPMKMKVQPLKDHELLLLPEADRSRDWQKIWVQDGEVRTAQQGTNGWEADEFEWLGYRYQVMKDRTYVDSCLDHKRAWAARIEVSAGQ